MKTFDQFLALLRSYPSRIEGDPELMPFRYYLDPKDWELLGVYSGSVMSDYRIGLTRENLIHTLCDAVSKGFMSATAFENRQAKVAYLTASLVLWLLDDPLYGTIKVRNMYGYFGLPLFRTIAVKFGFHNEIGYDTGFEKKFEKPEERFYPDLLEECV